MCNPIVGMSLSVLGDVSRFLKFMLEGLPLNHMKQLSVL